MNLIHNELVRKYFGSDTCLKADTVDHDWLNCMAKNVIEAMQTPIRKGERYLDIYDFKIMIAQSEFLSESMALSDWHPSALRLPDVFQKQECACKNMQIGYQVHSENVCSEFSDKNLAGHHYIKPPPSPEKCDCLHPSCSTCSPGNLKPKDAVDKQIEWIVSNEVPDAKDALESSLRDLVRLARESVPECKGDH